MLFISPTIYKNKIKDIYDKRFAQKNFKDKNIV